MGPVPAPTAQIATPPTTASTRSPVKIALLLPLGGMGETAAVAKSMKQAAEMALFEVNDPSVQLVTKDDGGTTAGARAAADAAVKEGAEIILGPLFSQAVAGAAPVARQANVPIVAFSNDAQIAGKGVYLMSFLAEEEVNRIVGFAASQGKKRFAALIPDNAYGNVVEAAFRRAVERAGGTVAIIEKYPPAANGMLGPAKRVVEAIKRGEEEMTPDRRTLPAGRPGCAAADRPGHRLFWPRYAQGEAARHRRLGLPVHRQGRGFRRRLVPEPRSCHVARLCGTLRQGLRQCAAAHRQHNL